MLYGRRIQRNSAKNLLLVKIHGIKDVSSGLPPRLATSIKNFYKAIAWIDHRKQSETQMVSCPENPYLDEHLVIPVESPAKYVYVDVLREHSAAEPGTSNGYVLVGRLKVPCPPIVGCGGFFCEDLLKADINGGLVAKGRIAFTVSLVDRVEFLFHRLKVLQDVLQNNEDNFPTPDC